MYSRDQELRFTVHDSPDYHNLKVSVFNDDKKTELIGETWVNLAQVIVPGGGQSDTWHNLNCRGKYAGEVRMELTYYDSRPKPEKPEGSAHSSVKRRPLQSNPESARSLPPGFGSEPRPLPSASGPRDFGTPSRRQMQAHSISAGNTPLQQGRTAYSNHELDAPDHGQPLQELASDQQPYRHSSQTISNVYPTERDAYYSDPPVGDARPSHTASLYNDDPFGLPELPPMDSSRHSRFVRGNTEPAPDRYTFPQDLGHPQLHHSYSAPTPETQHSDYAPLPGLDHTQSDSVLSHGQPIGQQLDLYQEPDRQPDPYRNHHQGSHGSETEDYGLPDHQRYDRFRQHEDTFDLSSQIHPKTYETRHHSLPPEFPDLGAPPPPAHRSHGSTPSISAHGDARSAIHDDFTPAPLNISTSRFPWALARETSPVEHRPEMTSSPYHDLTLAVPRDDPYYSSPPTYAPNDMARPSSRHELPSDAPPLYGYDPREDSPSNGHHRVHRKSLDYHHDPYRQSAHGAEAQFGTVTQLRERHTSAPYPQQSPLMAPDRMSPYNQEQPSPPAKYTPPQRQTPPRPYTMYGSPTSGPYQPSSNYNTPPRRHPLSQQQDAADIGSNYRQYSSPPVTTDEAPIIKPRPISPDPRQASVSNRSTPITRKSISPRPNPSERRSSDVPFGPDSYDQFNPRARSTSSVTNNPAASGPHTPMGTGPNSSHQSPYTEDDGLIVDFHGNTIDPSDRLPESSWAPEPEKKVHIKIKPLRERERLNGARPSPDSAPSTNKPSPKHTPPYPSASPSTSPLAARTSLDTTPTTAAMTVARNKLRKLNAPAPAPGPRPHSLSAFPADTQPRLDGPSTAGTGSAAGALSVGASPYGAPQPPPIPAKIPLDEGRGDDLRALSEEMRRIDIGSVAGGGVVGRRRLLGFRE